MEASISASLLHDSLSSTVERAVRSAVETVLCETMRFVWGQLSDFQNALTQKDVENANLKLILGETQTELKALRETVERSPHPRPPVTPNADGSEAFALSSSQLHNGAEGTGYGHWPRQSGTTPDGCPNTLRLNTLLTASVSSDAQTPDVSGAGGVQPRWDAAAGAPDCAETQRTSAPKRDAGGAIAGGGERGERGASGGPTAHQDPPAQPRFLKGTGIRTAGRVG
nr:PREDICTED: uncharacterized protein LOC107075719 [Lepisosteus oculatus]